MDDFPPTTVSGNWPKAWGDALVLKEYYNDWTDLSDNPPPGRAKNLATQWLQTHGCDSFWRDETKEIIEAHEFHPTQDVLELDKTQWEYDPYRVLHKVLDLIIDKVGEDSVINRRQFPHAAPDLTDKKVLRLSDRVEGFSLV